MGPIDYSTGVAQPFESVLQGFQAGGAIQQQALAQQQAQAQLAMQQQQRQVISSLINNPRAGADQYAQAMLLVPQLKDQLKQSWETKNAGQQQNDVSNLAKWGAAIQNGQPQLASAEIRARADAMERGGASTPESQALRQSANIIDQNPAFGRFLIKARLAAAPGGDKVVEALAKLGAEDRAQQQAPADLLKKAGDASKALTEAGIASAAAPADVQKRAADAAKAATDASIAAGSAPALIDKPAFENAQAREAIETARAQRQIVKFNADIAAANSETERGRLTLERDKFIADQKIKQQDIGTETQDRLDALNQALSTVQAVRAHPGLNQVGDVRTSLVERIPGSELKDFSVLLQTLKSQQFTAAIAQMKGMGQLSDAEGKKIESSVAALDTSMSPGAFKNALGVIETNLKHAQAKATASGKLPTAGGAFVMAHPTFGAVNEGDINRLLKQFPGSTREQVIQYLNTSAAKPAGVR